MTKFLLNASSLEEIKKLDFDGYIIGIKDFSFNTNLNITIEELELNKEFLNNKEIFISLNKNIVNSELEVIENYLKILNNYSFVKGIFYYDISILTIYNNLKLNFDLVYSAEHLTTNYNTINFWNSFGVKYACISNDITEEEIKEIINNSKCKLMINLFGYLPMFVSKRNIVKNYLDYIGKKDNSIINYIKKEGKLYPIIDNNIGTSVYSNNILNGIKTSLNIKVDYIIMNSFGISIDVLKEVLYMFKTVNNKNLESYNDKINSMYLNMDTGFLYNKTVYKVKKNEK